MEGAERICAIDQNGRVAAGPECAYLKALGPWLLSAACSRTEPRQRRDAFPVPLAGPESDRSTSVSCPGPAGNWQDGAGTDRELALQSAGGMHLHRICVPGNHDLGYGRVAAREQYLAIAR